MAASLKLKIDLREIAQGVAAQFQDLDRNDPSSWPQIPRYALLFAVTVACVVALWFVWLSDAKDALAAEQAKENGLKTEYQTKLAKAVNLPALKKKREQVQLYVSQIEKQLPSKAEMDALLSDINQAGLGRSLQFELFRPGQVAVRDYYAELPIALRVVGKYHDMGAFVADVANLSRIVTLNNVKIAPVKDSSLSMEATAKTFRYLDNIEVAAQQSAAKKGKKK